MPMASVRLMMRSARPCSRGGYLKSILPLVRPAACGCPGESGPAVVRQVVEWTNIRPAADVRTAACGAYGSSQARGRDLGRPRSRGYRSATKIQSLRLGRRWAFPVVTPRQEADLPCSWRLMISRVQHTSYWAGAGSREARPRQHPAPFSWAICCGSGWPLRRLGACCSTTWPSSASGWSHLLPRSPQRPKLCCSEGPGCHLRL